MTRFVVVNNHECGDCYVAEMVNGRAQIVAKVADPGAPGERLSYRESCAVKLRWAERIAVALNAQADLEDIQASFSQESG